MMLTAHGGAMKTGRNSRRFFETVHRYPVDVIEVDVRRRKNRLYISHGKALFSNRAIALSYVFDYISQHGLKVNCDLKEKGIIGDVIRLAESKGVADRLIFTGNIAQKDLPDITAGEVYVNIGYYFPIIPIAKNLETIKDILEKGGNRHIKGLNIPYQLATEQFIDRANELGIPLSVYTVDNPFVLKKLICRNIANITTNALDKAIELMKECHLGDYQ